MIKHTLDASVIRQWSENCAIYRRRTRWLLPVVVCCTSTPILAVHGFGAAVFPAAFSVFALGLLVVGVRLGMTTALLYCPQCGRRPLKPFNPGYSATLWRLRSLLRARFCEHCYYWLEHPQTPYG